MTSNEQPFERRPTRWQFGPGLLIAAAFIGPGTVTTASVAGARFGFALLWALVFSVVATVVLQEMAARLGLVARMGLADAIRQSISPVWARWLAIGIVLVAIAVGNTAYQTGNLMGAGVGISQLTGLSVEFGAVVVGIAIAIVFLLGVGNRYLYRVLVGIVLVMSCAFLATAVIVGPNVPDVARGMLTVSIPKGSILTIMALIGTTVVPYNLFLHATAVQQRWPFPRNTDVNLRLSRFDTVLSIAIGGVVTMAIVVSAATTLQSAVPTGNLSEMTKQLEPLLGSSGSLLFAFGLAAAGITSGITAPLAAGYTIAGAFPNASQKTVKATCVAVVLIGTLLAGLFGKSPQATIVVAQAANAILLPLVAVFLLVVMNRRELLGDHCNGPLLNVAGAIVVLVAIGLGATSLLAIGW